ncbi:spermidine/putrescine ABC transporter substrate-binding protein [Candidatus Dependentiae bacterium]|nr:spermidine/putrescine ABC transporter substrate-binding protein [Candidatus Dependentiae bacterium]
MEILFKKYFIKFLIILFWILTIIGFIYIPEFVKHKFSKRTINIFTWSDIFDPNFVAQFEVENNCRLNFNYYESNEELLIKFKTTSGKGYDLIIPSDYAVEDLRKSGLLKKIDKSKLNFLSNLNPLFLGQYFDPNNEYSVPLEWALYGIGVDYDQFPNHKLTCGSWDLVFKRKCVPTTIAMVNDPREAIMFAANYLFNKTSDLSSQELDQIKQLFLKQREFVEAYVEFRADYLLLTKNCSTVVCPSPYIWRLKTKYKNIDFIIPENGRFFTIENVVLPIDSKEDDLVYKFINYIFDKNVVAHHFNSFGFFPCTTDVLDIIDIDEQAKKILSMSKEEFAKFKFFKTNVPDYKIHELWISVKA